MRSERWPKSLRELRAFLDRQPYAAEVIVVDDGSSDATADLVREAAQRWPALRLLQTPQSGKGHAVRQGLLAARGVYSFFCDADFSMPVSQIPKFLPPQLTNVDIAIATREGPGARRFGEPLRRHIMGRIYNALVRALALPGIQDSQCGFKCLRADIGRQLAAVQTINDFGFDVELLYVARQWGYRIVEIPVDWYYSPSPNIHALRDSWRMTRDLLTVRRLARAGHYHAAPSAVSAPTSTVHV